MTRYKYLIPTLLESKKKKTADAYNPTSGLSALTPPLKVTDKLHTVLCLIYSEYHY